MRRLIALATVSLSALGLGVSATAASAQRHDLPPTQVTIVRPVNAAGFARPGYTVRSEPTNLANCSFADPAPSAVSPNIENCFPTAASAYACWKAAALHKILCLRDPRVRKLARIPRQGPFAATGLVPADQRAPLSVVLGNGDYCAWRNGGAGPQRLDHPQWAASYYCNSGKVIWARPGAHHYGVFERFPSWTVIVAGETGPIAARHVLRAWFVGTFTA